MRVKVDLALCQGHAVCMQEAPEVFRVNETDGHYPKVEVILEFPPEDLRARLEVLPQSYLADRKIVESFTLATSTARGKELLQAALSAGSDSTWPEAHYLGPLHPVLDWAADRRHPCSVLGMLYALEVIASVYGGPFAAAIRESLLLEGEHGVSFIGSHASLDARHMAELRQLMNRLHGEEALAAVVESTRVNFHHFTRIVEAV